MKSITRGQKGFTLIEILIVLALMAVLAAIVIPNVQGFLGRGKDDSYKVDKKTLQAAVDGYYTKNNAFPTFLGGTTGGVPTGGSNTYIDTDGLATAKFLNDTPSSSNSYNEASGAGTYGWYVDSSGRVQSIPTYTGAYP